MFVSVLLLGLAAASPLPGSQAQDAHVEKRQQPSLFGPGAGLDLTGLFNGFIDILGNGGQQGPGDNQNWGSDSDSSDNDDASSGAEPPASPYSDDEAAPAATGAHQYGYTRSSPSPSVSSTYIYASPSSSHVYSTSSPFYVYTGSSSAPSAYTAPSLPPIVYPSPRSRPSESTRTKPLPSVNTRPSPRPVPKGSSIPGIFSLPAAPIPPTLASVPPAFVTSAPVAFSTSAIGTRAPAGSNPYTTGKIVPPISGYMPAPTVVPARPATPIIGLPRLPFTRTSSTRTQNYPVPIVSTVASSPFNAVNSPGNLGGLNSHNNQRGSSSGANGLLGGFFTALFPWLALKPSTSVVAPRPTAISLPYPPDGYSYTLVPIQPTATGIGAIAGASNTLSAPAAYGTFIDPKHPGTVIVVVAP